MSENITKAQAAEYLRMIAFGVQKLRSIMAEDGFISDDKALKSLHISNEQAARVWGWVWGNKCILIPVTKMLDGYESEGRLAPLDFANIMYVAFVLEPLIAAVAGIEAAVNGKTFPFEFNSEWYFPFSEE